MHELPIDIRVALGSVAAPEDCATATVVGDRDLMTAFARLTPIERSESRLIALGAATDELRAAVAERQPATITVLASGRLAAALRPVRVNAFPLAADLTPAEWSRAGYEVVRARSYLGLAPVIWLTAERVLRRLSRPDLADRCRVAAQETMVAASWVGRFGAVVVAEYRRHR